MFVFGSEVWMAVESIVPFSVASVPPICVRYKVMNVVYVVCRQTPLFWNQ